MDHGEYQAVPWVQEANWEKPRMQSYDMQDVCLRVLLALLG